ncbi:hypothetical protein HMPREF9453_01533 [Dialister succinatiphilus YIT 11850]|uniref:Uncharacterized protein n=1 Tax=Dialister succinatiphilus YIT 11850 TaxID=742743 RepID=H1D1P5_9FIRM|nr:hypothetical protein HMPREF9453_01533 [Dialister succinatiphilus YIT 11850]
MAASPQFLKKGRGWRRRLCRRVVKGKVLKMDGPSAQGFLSLTGPLAPRVADCRSAAMLMKSALRDLLLVSYGKIIILVISRCAAPPYPAAPDFLHGKACHTILRSLCSLTNRVPLPPHPGDRINHSMLSCRDMAPWLSTHSAPSKRGKGGGASHQRGIHRNGT